MAEFPAFQRRFQLLEQCLDFCLQRRVQPDQIKAFFRGGGKALGQITGMIRLSFDIVRLQPLLS